MIAFFALLIAARDKLTRRDQQLLLAAVLFALLVFAFDLGHLYEWWLD